MLSSETTTAAEASKKHSFFCEPVVYASVRIWEHLPGLRANSLGLYLACQWMESHSLQSEGGGPALSNTQLYRIIKSSSLETSPAYTAWKVLFSYKASSREHDGWKNAKLQSYM